MLLLLMDGVLRTSIKRDSVLNGMTGNYTTVRSRVEIEDNLRAIYSSLSLREFLWMIFSMH